MGLGEGEGKEGRIEDDRGREPSQRGREEECSGKEGKLRKSLQLYFVGIYYDVLVQSVWLMIGLEDHGLYCVFFGLRR